MPTLEEIRHQLTLPDPSHLPDYAALLAELAAQKKASLVAGDQATAKEIWCLEHTVEIHQLHKEAFDQLQARDYFKAWCTLEKVELALGRLRKHFAAHWVGCRLAFIEKVTFALQKMYPYKWFMSPELLEERKSCTICGCVVSIRNHCGHEVGEIYDGEYCGRSVDKFQILGSALVRDPVQKYSVIFPADPKTGQSIDRYNYKTVEYLVRRWPTPYSDWNAEWTRRPHPKSKFEPIRRNNKCPCDSGKKYKKCCMNLDGIMRPHVVIEFAYPIPAELETTEYSY